ncbi:MAG: hypothetical protein AAGB15_02025 [Pseudomonadota bacterium]
MSFFRPEAKAALRRFGEPVLYFVVAIIGLWQGLRLINQGSWAGAVLMGLGGLAALAVFNAAERALVAWRARRAGPGLVSIQEGRIAYFGPNGGAVMALDALVRVEIITTNDGPMADDHFWQLTDETGQIAVIPGGAQDATDLLDRLGSLPGFDHMAVISAMGSTENARFLVWQKPAQVASGLS